ncbi:MAG: TonB-dependent receptor, partial [Bryobacteraceae bacterium]
FQKRRTQVRAGYALQFNGSIYNQFPSRLAAQPPFANTATVNTSVDRVLTIQNGFATTPSQTITNTYAVDRHYRVAYAQTWSLSVQQPVARSWVAEIGYLGAKGTRLDVQRLPNRAAPGSPLTAEQRRQIGNAVGFTFDSAEGNSIYHAGTIRLTRRFTHGVSSNLSYAYAKSIDNASSLGGGAAVVAQNDKDLSAERARSSFDQRHALSLNWVVNSPVSESAKVIPLNGLGLRLFKDWTLSGGLTASSGTPLTARVLGSQADTGGTGSVGSGRADVTGQPIGAGDGFFNLLAFAVPVAGFGNAGRNTIDGPNRFAMNLSLSRAFRLDERRRLEFRLDSQNFLNHASFTGLGTVVNALNYGLPTGVSGMRTINTTLRLRF